MKPLPPPPDGDPTPEEIRAACDEIQSEWTEHERRRRGRSERAGMTVDARMSLTRAEMADFDGEWS